MTLLRIPLVSIAWAGYMIGNTAPVSRPRGVERDHYQNLNLSERFIQSVANGGPAAQRALVSVVAITEILFAFSDSQHQPQLKALLCGHLASGAHAAITPLFLLGVALAGAGGAIRLACYRALGPFFTYELSIREKHRLITTGPYGVVRHPGYTGIAMFVIGCTLCELASGSWWSEAHVFNSALGKVIASGWLCSVLILTTVILRAPKEDRALKETFGKEWIIYAETVPYRYIPLLL